ncbi:hypothetical protein MFRU_006g02590 [Monilinia fructicola]|nr:hypothetical protein MFRU_006g02590 [Monilinia fructicola]
MTTTITTATITTTIITTTTITTTTTTTTTITTTTTTAAAPATIYLTLLSGVDLQSLQGWIRLPSTNYNIPIARYGTSR